MHGTVLMEADENPLPKKVNDAFTLYALAPFSNGSRYLEIPLETGATIRQTHQPSFAFNLA